MYLIYLKKYSTSYYSQWRLSAYMVKIDIIVKNAAEAVYANMVSSKNVAPIAMVQKYVNQKRNLYNTGCRQLGNRKYDGFCTHCFANLFPDDPKKPSIKKKQRTTSC